MTEVDVPPEAPAWMQALEKKQQRVHRLAHEVGAGSPCLLCKDDCPGLDLHFWRKLCRNCKCKKEDHDVIDEYGVEQFEILLGSGRSSRPNKAFLDLLEKHTSARFKTEVKNLAFEWVPPDVSPVIAAEYMQALPYGKLPISGSDGALYRRQQLERQLPLHDLDASQCHQLTESEVENLKKYLENLKNNVVGQGRVTKLQIPTSTSLDSLQKMCTFNSVPKPFQSFSGTNSSLDKPAEFAVGCQVSSSPAHLLKPPSAFLPKSISPEPFRSRTPDLPLSSVADRGAAFGVTLSPASQRVRRTPKSFAPGGLDGSDSEESLDRRAGTSSPFGNHNVSKHLSDAQLLKEHTPTTVAQSANVPGRMWVPAECPECAQKSLDGKLVHERVCSHIVKSDSVSDQLQPRRTSPIQCFHCSRKGPDGLLIRDHMCCHIAASENIPQLQSGLSVPLDCNECSKKALDGQLINDHVCTHIANAVAVPHLSQSAQIIPGGCLGCQRVGPDGKVVNDGLCTHQAKTYDSPHYLESGFSEYAKNGLDGRLVHDQVCSLLAKADNVSGTLHSSQMIPAPGDCSECLGRVVDGQMVSDKMCVHKSQAYDTAPKIQPGQILPLESRGKFLSPDISVDPPLTSAVSSKADSVNQNINQDSISALRGNPFTNSRMSPVLHSDTRNLQSPSSSLPSSNLSQDGILVRNKPSTGMMSASGAPHMMALYAHNALNAPGLDPQDSLSPNIAAISIDDNVHSLGDIGTPSNLPIDSNIPLELKLNCAQCSEGILPEEVVVFADRAGLDVVWHPQCFVCNTCQELLVDLVYFFSKGHVYCGRHYAELLDIPRCSACDELIFVKEYTVAEGQAFHVKHFCCFECDEPLGGMQYVPKDDQPVCLPCYGQKYGKQCTTCGLVIGAKDQGVSWKELHWHATSQCFCCNFCQKSLLGGRFAVKEQRPFCSKECMQAGISTNHQKVTSV